VRVAGAVAALPDLLFYLSEEVDRMEVLARVGGFPSLLVRSDYRC
jgi:hypothetical protein